MEPTGAGCAGTCGDVLRLAALGVIVGVGGWFAVHTVLASELYGVPSNHPLTVTAHLGSFLSWGDVCLVNVIKPQGLEPLQFSTKFRSPSRFGLGTLC